MSGRPFIYLLCQLARELFFSLLVFKSQVLAFSSIHLLYSFQEFSRLSSVVVPTSSLFVISDKRILTSPQRHVCLLSKDRSGASRCHAFVCINSPTPHQVPTPLSPLAPVQSLSWFPLTVSRLLSCFQDRVYSSPADQSTFAKYSC